VKRILLVAVFLLPLCSCLVLQPRCTRDRYIEPGYAEMIEQAALNLDSVAVRRGIASGALEANATYILELMLRRHNAETSNPGHALSMRALIKEEEFSREFRSWNAVTVELSLFDPQGSKAVALALYSENTKETIDSYAYLHSVTRRALRLLIR
jgi:hypothetical protein